MDRRAFVRTVGAATAVGLAGCGGRGGDGGGPATEEFRGVSVEDHPAAADLEAQPHEGNLDGHVVLAFEDPSCGTCQWFHEQTVPDLERELVETGEGAYVTRLRPIVLDWGEPASKALAAVHDRDEATYWTLLDHYFDEQGSFDDDTVLDATATYLSEETDLDGDAVVADVEAGAYDDAIQANLDAAAAAGLPERSPIILLFRDGEYVEHVNSGGWSTIGGVLGEA